jgi:hypothetical protein
MGMQQRLSVPYFVQNNREHARVDTGPPVCRPHRHAGFHEPPAQFGIFPCDDDLRDGTPLELAGQEPDLPLSAAPLPA